MTRAGNDGVKHMISFILYYVHRYLRITIPYFLVMGIIISVLPYVYYGPGWDTIIRESQVIDQHRTMTQFFSDIMNFPKTQSFGHSKSTLLINPNL